MSMRRKDWQPQQAAVPYKKEFNSINEFYKYICNTPINSAFRWKSLSSVERGSSFTGTNSFDEATELLHNGWSTMAEKLQQRLKAETKMEPIKQQRNVLSVSGYQPVIPLYLAGVPQNMVSKQMVSVKSKIVDVVKLLNYNCGVEKGQIETESIKAMQVVQKLERMGYRVNLYIALGVNEDNRNIICKIKIKSAGERLNVSKLAFPMVHPSMLRRLFFRYIEVNPDVTERFTLGYGRPVSYVKMKETFPNAVVLPAIFSGDIESVKDLKTLEAIV